MRKFYLLALGLFAGCSEKPAPTVPDSTIVLECSGKEHLLSPERTEDMGYLIRYDPLNRYQNALHFYSSSEQRFVSPCESNFSSCVAHAGPDLITESGTLEGTDGQVLLTKQTSINRRTGSMTITMNDRVLGPRVIFEGSCQKGTLPVEPAAKF